MEINKEMLKDYIIDLRRKFHQVPEIGWELPKTVEIVKKELVNMKIKYREIETNAILASINCKNNNAPTLVFRTDMDALNIDEKWKSNYTSIHPGKMHACGHDGHMAIMLGFLKILTENLDKLNCNIVVLFQPAEEIMEGSRIFLNEIELSNAMAIFAIHLWTPMDSGKICTLKGPRMSSADRFKIILKGKSSHGGEPHRGVDTILAASNLIMSLQTIISRRVDPNKSAVLTIGNIYGGTAYNIVASEVTLEGTVRCFDPNLRKNMELNIKNMTKNIASGYECDYEIEYYYGTPAVINHPIASKLATDAATKIMGVNSIIDFPKIGAGEDFALLMEKVPGCLILLGAKTDDFYPHHHDKFNINENVLINGALIFWEIVQSF